MVPESVTNAALTYYSSEDAKITLTDYIKDHLLAFLTLILLVTLLIAVLLLRSIRAEKKADEEHHLVNALNNNVVNLSPGQASELKNCPCCCGSIYAPAAAHDGRNAFPA